jgi:hypothetical protein
VSAASDASDASGAAAWRRVRRGGVAAWRRVRRKRRRGDVWCGDVSDAATSERATDGVTRLRVAEGPLLRPALRRVVSMVLTRADWPLDRLEEALLVCDALCTPRDAGGDGRESWSFSVEADEREAELRVCQLEPERAERLVRDAQLPLVGNVLERLAERVTIERDETGSRAQLAIVLSAR